VLIWISLIDTNVQAAANTIAVGTYSFPHCFMQHRLNADVLLPLPALPPHCSPTKQTLFLPFCFEHSPIPFDRAHLSLVAINSRIDCEYRLCVSGFCGRWDWLCSASSGKSMFSMELFRRGHGVSGISTVGDGMCSGGNM
jgi:hypothetical protein